MCHCTRRMRLSWPIYVWMCSVEMFWIFHNPNLPSWLTKTVQLAVSVCTHCKRMWDTCRTGEGVDPCHLVGLEVQECEFQVAPLKWVPMDLPSLKICNIVSEKWKVSWQVIHHAVFTSMLILPFQTALSCALTGVERLLLTGMETPSSSPQRSWRCPGRIPCHHGQ